MIESNIEEKLYSISRQLSHVNIQYVIIISDENKRNEQQNNNEATILKGKKFRIYFSLNGKVLQLLLTKQQIDMVHITRKKRVIGLLNCGGNI
jgi:hypothetical protein